MRRSESTLLGFALLTFATSCAATSPTPASPPVARAEAPVQAPSPPKDQAEVVEAPPLQLPPASSPPTAPPPPPPKPVPKDKPSAAITPARDPMLEELLAGGGEVLKKVIATPEMYRFQVLYGIVKDDPKPSIERHGWRADAEYFFPASSMKVPIALASFDRLPAMRKAGAQSLGRDVTLRFPSGSAASAEPITTTLARETWKALIVSDNFSANRLLAFVGHRELHETLWSLGLKSARVHTGFATGEAIAPAELSPRIEVAASGATEEIAPRTSTLKLPATDAAKLDLGVAALIDGRQVAGPMSFAQKNAMRVTDLQNTLIRIMRPELLPPGAPKDAASREDLAYLREALGTLPSESGLPGYQRNVVADYLLCPLLRGIERVRKRGEFAIYSKVGQAYGFLVVNAYVVDKVTSRAFFVTAAVYANPDEIMNDDKYGYDAVSFPALADVGEVLSRHAFGQPPR